MMNRFRVKLKKLVASGQGNALVEFALTFPTLVVITLMIFDLGRALFVYTTVNNVAAEGARYAALHGSGNVFTKTSSEIEDYIQQNAAGLELDNLTITITYTPSTFTGSEVAVQIDYDLGFFLSGVIDMIGGGTDASLTLTGKSTMSVL